MLTMQDFSFNVIRANTSFTRKNKLKYKKNPDLGFTQTKAGIPVCHGAPERAAEHRLSMREQAEGSRGVGGWQEEGISPLHEGYVNVLSYRTMLRSPMV